MSSSNRALVMLLADLSTSPRPRRIICLLSDYGYEIHAYSYTPEPTMSVAESFVFPAIRTTLWPRVTRVFFRVLASLLARAQIYSDTVIRLSDRIYGLHKTNRSVLREDYELIVVEDLQLLPFAFRSFPNAKILFDAREFYTRQNEESLLFRLFEYPVRQLLCELYLRKCDHLITVSEGLADAYRREFKVTASVIKSVPYYRELPVNEMSNDSIKMVYHGKAKQNRGLHNLIEVMRHLDERFHLDLYLVGGAAEIERIRTLSSDLNRIRVLPPVPFDSIIEMLTCYDIGFFYCEPTTFNLLHCLPNKFFEFIQARIALAIGPSPDMAALVREYGCGFIAEDFTVESMRATLCRLSNKEIMKAKYQSNMAARQLCFEVEGKSLAKLLDLV